MELHNLASLTQNLNMTRLFRGVALGIASARRVTNCKRQKGETEGLLAMDHRTFHICRQSAFYFKSMSGNLA